MTLFIISAYSIVPEHIDSSNFLDISFRIAVYWCSNNNLIIAGEREGERGEREREREGEGEREGERERERGRAHMYVRSNLETVNK